MSWDEPWEGEILFDDGESPDWDPPMPPDPAKLPDNTSSWGPFYCWRGEARAWQFPLGMAITHEIHPPWHHGVGVVLRYGLLQQFGGWRDAVAVGVWWRGHPPAILNSDPVEKNLQSVVSKSRQLQA